MTQATEHYSAERPRTRTAFAPLQRLAGERSVVFVLAAVLGACGAIYTAGIFSTYAFADDYSNVDGINTPGNQFLPSAIGAGRSVSGLVQLIAFRQVDSIGELGFLRVFGVIGLVLTALVVAWNLRLVGVGALVAGAAAVGVVTMPSSLVVGIWATMFPVAYATAGALVAGVIAYRTPLCRDRRTIARYAVVLLILLIALQNYQPSATAYWAAILALVATETRRSRELVRPAVVVIALFGSGLALYMLSTKISIALGALEQPNENRTFYLAPIHKLDWFVTDVLPMSVAPFSFEPSPVVTVLVAAVLIGGVWLRMEGSSGDRAIRLLLAAACLPASYVSNLVVREDWPTARTRLALDVCLVIVGALALEGWARTIRRQDWRGPIVGATAVLLAASFTVLAAQRATRYVTAPLHAERLRGEQILEGATYDPAQPLYLIAPSQLSTTAPGIVYDEFGMPALAVSWGLESFVRLELQGDDRPLPAGIVIVLPWETDMIPAGSQALDFTAAR